MGVHNQNHNIDTRKSRANLHNPSPRQPPLVVGLVGEGLNEPLNSQGCNQCGIITHTKEAEVVLKLNGVHVDENMSLLFGSAITKDKSSQRERRHGVQKPQSRNRHQMLVGDREQTPTKRPHAAFVGNDLVGEGLNEPSNSQ
jgi:hypothetical protein